jgi:hypothetical protein
MAEAPKGKLDVTFATGGLMVCGGSRDSRFASIGIFGGTFFIRASERQKVGERDALENRGFVVKIRSPRDAARSTRTCRSYETTAHRLQVSQRLMGPDSAVRSGTFSPSPSGRPVRPGRIGRLRCGQTELAERILKGGGRRRSGPGTPSAIHPDLAVDDGMIVMLASLPSRRPRCAQSGPGVDGGLAVACTTPSAAALWAFGHPRAAGGTVKTSRRKPEAPPRSVHRPTDHHKPHRGCR